MAYSMAWHRGTLFFASFSPLSFLRVSVRVKRHFLFTGISSTLHLIMKRRDGTGRTRNSSSAERRGEVSIGRNTKQKLQVFNPYKMIGTNLHRCIRNSILPYFFLGSHPLHPLSFSRLRVSLLHFSVRIK